MEGPRCKQAKKHLIAAAALALAWHRHWHSFLPKLRGALRWQLNGPRLQLESRAIAFRGVSAGRFRATSKPLPACLPTHRSYQDIQEHMAHGAMDLSPDDMTSQAAFWLPWKKQAAPSASSHSTSEPVFDRPEAAQ